MASVGLPPTALELHQHLFEQPFLPRGEVSYVPPVPQESTGDGMQSSVVDFSDLASTDPVPVPWFSQLVLP
jgi:hypothetical protein